MRHAAHLRARDAAPEGLEPLAIAMQQPGAGRRGAGMRVTVAFARRGRGNEEKCSRAPTIHFPSIFPSRFPPSSHPLNSILSFPSSFSPLLSL